MKKNKKTEEQKRWSAVIESVLEKINRTPWDNSTAPCGGIIKWRGDGALPTTLKSDYIDDMKDDIGKTGGPQETDAKKLAEMNQWDKDDLYLFEDAEMDGSSVDDLPDFENEDDDDVEAAKKDAEEKSDSDADSDDEDDVDDILDDLEGEDEDEDEEIES